MKDVHWEAVHDAFTAIERLLGSLEALGERPRGQGDESEAPDITSDAEETVVRVRAQVRDQMDVLRSRLSETLGERDVYLVLFPIVAYCDEYVQTRYLSARHLSWPPLQKELFGIQDAGEIFYDTIDDLLMKPNTLPFIHEVFFFCLKNGFLGRYETSQVKRAEYLQRLQMKIPVVSPEAHPVEPPAMIALDKTRSPYWYYAGVGAALILAYLLLVVAAHVWNPLY